MKKVCICAGGTGGHINAALALGEKLSQRYEVNYYTGTRTLDYKLFPENSTHLPAKGLRGKDLLSTANNVFFNLLAFLKAFAHQVIRRPIFAIGTGGYVCGPTLMAAKMLGVPIFILEQNAIAGTTNKILSKYSEINFLNFSNTKGIDHSSRNRVVGNPIRSNITAARLPTINFKKVLIFGGSLGAESFKDIAISLVEKGYQVTHQTGLNNLVNYTNDNYIKVAYIDDMNAAYSDSDFIICRAGASSLSELEVLQKPVILIPYPLAVDDHQNLNAQYFKQKVRFPVEVVTESKELVSHVIEAIERLKKTDMYTTDAIIADATTLIIKNIEESL